ncbi:MAG TPA: hypothetical protein DE061_01030 [Clostridiales bacterium]|nr:hypothetical protein [Clostridiales bacterium]HBP52443.1 hypothetical protein [Clostridiales bacterium]HCH92266.1 hypothetical protein [Clostridiales bacterium]
MSKKVMAVVAVVALVAILGICLVACNAESYEKKLEKAGYTVTSMSADEAKEEGAEWGVVGVKGTDMVTVVKFAKTDDAKEFESNVPTLGIGSLKVVVARVGSIVFYGTEAGVKAAK